MKVIFFCRAFLCDLLIYFLMVLIGFVGYPYAKISREKTYQVIRVYCHSCFFVLHYVAGLKVEVRGKVPDSPGLICSKHQSFLDILILASVLPDYRFISKHQLAYFPVIGFYASRIGCVYVNRKKKMGTTKQMITELNKDICRQTVIYPQGTRVLPYAKVPYKIGAGLIYQSGDLPCYLAATNTGMFWARRSAFRYPGKAIVEFLGCVDPGMPIENFMSEIEERIERASETLRDEAERSAN